MPAVQVYMHLNADLFCAENKAHTCVCRKEVNMNPGTIIVLGVVVLIVCLIVCSLYKDKKSGKSQCGGDCSRCRGCH